MATGSSQSQSTSATAVLEDEFRFPAHYSFPPFFTLQPNVTTLSTQLNLWFDLILSYCKHYRQFKLSVSTIVNSPLFNNGAIGRRLDVVSIRRVLNHMTSAEGDRRAEWAVTPGAKSKTVDEQSVVWIYWKRPEEWGECVFAWVNDTGQKGSVLTVYELRESDAVQKMDWRGMDEDMFRKCLDTLCKGGKAQIFGNDQESGVKFF